MKRVRFFGFESQAPVSVEVQTEGRKQTANIEKWGIVEGGEVTIDVRRSALRVAPDGVYFEAQVAGFDAPGPAAGRIYDPRMHELHYEWDFGDTGARFDKPQNLMPEWRDANKSFGPRVSHTYKAPGDYTVTVTVTEPDSGKQATATATVTVEDPDTLFSGARTIYVSPTGNTTYAPAGSVMVPDMAAAVSTHSDSVVPRRIMFERGAQHVAQHHSIGEYHANVYLCAGSGPGTRPQITYAGPADRAMVDTIWRETEVPGDARDIVVTGLEFIGPYNALTGEGVETTCFGTAEPKHKSFLIDDVIIRGFGFTISLRPSQSETLHTFNDSIITDWKCYGIFESRSWRTGITGMSMIQNPDGVSGHERGDKNTFHGPYRGPQGFGVVVDGCEFYSNTGWFVNLHPYRTQQPCFRFNTNGKAGGFINMQRTTCEGGQEMVSISSEGAHRVGGAVNAILDKLVLLGSHMSSYGIRVQQGGVTIRNVLAIFPDTPRLYDDTFDFDPRSLVNYEDPMGTPNKNATDQAIAELSRTEPVRVYNNTVVNLVRADTMKKRDRIVGDGFAKAELVNFTDVISVNNTTWQPNMDVPRTEDGPFEMTPVSWFQPRERGYQFLGQYVDGTLTSDVAPDGELAVAYPDGFDDVHFGEETLAEHAFFHGGSHNALNSIENMEIALMDTEVRVANRSQNTWPSGSAFRVFLDHRYGGEIPPVLDAYETPGDAVALYQPIGNSAVIGDALQEPNAFDDLFGNRRPVYPSRGATEVPG